MYLALELDGFYFEINANSGDKCRVESIIGKSISKKKLYKKTFSETLPKQDTCFTNARIANEQQFEE